MAKGSRSEGGTGRIVGRTAELERVGRFCEHADGEPNLLVLVGDAGSGKSTLLDAAADQALRRGTRVVRFTGYQGEQELVFGALHELLKPFLLETDRLPEAQRNALSRAFGLDVPETAQPGQERLLIALAAWELWVNAADRQPLLLAVDDLQWIDAASLDVLCFALRRTTGRPVAMLAASRRPDVVDLREPLCARLPVSALSVRDAEELLDRQPVPPRGLVRGRLLLQAGGNPLALVELAASAARQGSVGRSPWAERNADVPMTARLEALYAARLPDLPAATRAALLLAAAADSGETSPDSPAVLASADPARAAEVWQPAEEAGLVRIEHGRVLFRHPLVRSAVYQRVSFAQRRQAHLRLAEACAADPDRRAHHLAAATLDPDELVAQALLEAAARARRRGGFAVAATTLERAATLSPDTRDRLLRLAEACETATFAVDPELVESLASRIVAATEDPELLRRAALCSAWALAATAQPGAAVEQMLTLAASTVHGDPAIAIQALSKAAIAIYYTGDEAGRTRALALLARIPWDAGNPLAQIWARASCGPLTEREATVRALRTIAERPGLDADELLTLGGAALTLDETALAVTALSTVEGYERATTGSVPNPTLGHALAAAQFAAGAWDAAATSGRQARSRAEELGLDVARRSAAYVCALVHVHRGEVAESRACLQAALADQDLSRARGLDARCRAVRAAIAAAEGEYVLEYEILFGLFAPMLDHGADTGTGPLHFHAAYYALGDLAAAGARVGETAQARSILSAARRILAGQASARLEAQLERAEALLSADAEAERHFQAALGVPGAPTWPFEQAVTALEYGEWLRRRRRTIDAKAQLIRAAATFEQLGARPWSARATAELRACGVAASSPTEGTPVEAATQLTPQQLQIARLAATGLTNRQIGEQLFISPRTVSFHLYQAYPKLGVASRSQLRDALGPVDRAG
ncbi:AAA family ATPase [Actinospica durhamensis]|uniref:AAA family ATPase n=1 Tax=Actinospica durhamensis TaxID=1508375 RepID=A0A941ENM4_9ACTN|nr:LuxR family transcriptional regulator [Actinospica durhamensis]MBR7835022.1 AAA family ATPase [Actinospica durhamensis]